MNFILFVKVLTDMYFNYFTGIENCEKDPVEFIKEQIEIAIDLFEQDKNDGVIRPELQTNPYYTGLFFTKRYSTNPDLTNIDSDDLHSQCFDDSVMLRKIVLIYTGLSLKVAKSRFKSPYKRDAFEHYYLTETIGDTEIIIEPTIGQFLTNFKGIFVGTREQLKNLFLITMKVDPHSFSPRWIWYREIVYEPPEQMFEVIWGANSVEA